MTTKEAWLHIAEEFEAAKTDHDLASSGLCYAVRCLYVEHVITRDQHDAMRQQIKSHMNNLQNQGWFFPESFLFDFTPESFSKRAALARKFADDSGN